MNLIDMLERTARIYPSAPAVTFNNKTLVWHAFHARAKQLGGALAGLGISNGDRVGILAQNSARTIEAFFGPHYADAIMVQLNYRWSMREMLFCMEDCTPSVLLVDDLNIEQARELAKVCTFCRHLVFIGESETPEGFLDYEALLAAAEPANLPTRRNDDVAALFYTSGTTGQSKGVMLSHANLYINSMSAMASYRLPRLQTFLQTAPVFHLAAGSRVYTLVMAANHAVIAQKFDAVEALELICKHKVNDTIFVPTMVGMIFNHPDYDSYDLSSMNRISYGAAPMPEPLLRTVIKKLPGVQFFQGYGATETGPIVAILQPEAHDPDGPLADKLTSIGPPVFNVDLKIVDQEGNTCPTGEVGEITVRGPNIMLGYWNNPEETAKVLKDGWYSTGDGGYIDEGGYVFLVDRIKDMIITGGENVYSSEVENVVHDHPAVRECAAIGIPHDIWGEAVHAVITLRSGMSVTEDELIAFCRDKLSAYKCPKSVEVIDQMPISATNKILKNQLRHEREETPPNV